MYDARYVAAFALNYAAKIRTGTVRPLRMAIGP
jgi:hypothetical protein